MALFITEECINCDLCAEECPNEAITMGAEIYEINADKCTECVGHYEEPSCVGVCPVECIEVNPKRKETVAQLTEKFARLQA
ncbi:YfhL family 4Fe-4S dicluster ferredoxin [Brumicola pallidula]|uniref:Ferredoxin-1 n=1 Tax=Brumicola pallidula DSM 14239 = ACAM 615 TaxID=1121922 RepID=K7A397_9ALTE|nr:YfhL family 4Fe-4S dicluster ferredoxin [Glaciecola pallidula]GAC29970.1 ferredoxin-1 [Glaciecola pallidula DSM 14239 = ACAM 615]